MSSLVMSPKTHLILIHFSEVFCKISIDSYAKTWISHSNSILQKITAESKKITTELKVPTKPEESSLKVEMRSQLKIGVATRNSSVRLFPGHDITKTSLEREIEGFIKLVKTGN